MANMKRVLIQNACYHLITRGNQKQKIFRSSEDYLLYLSLLKKFKRKYGFQVYAYCLMPNHVHILGEIKNPPFLSKFMHDLNRVYTQYFNSKHEKVGHLWQGRFKSMIVVRDQYLIDCMNYIELNPLRAGLVKQPSEYLWTSYNSRRLGRNDKVTDNLPSL